MVVLAFKRVSRNKMCRLYLNKLAKSFDSFHFLRLNINLDVLHHDVTHPVQPAESGIVGHGHVREFHLEVGTVN